MNSKKVFISYGRDPLNKEHIDAVHSVKKILDDKGFQTFIDVDRLSTGSDWEVQLEQDIKSSDWLIFFITPYSARRPDGYCLNELACALQFNIPIIPVILEYETPPLSICRIQYFELLSSKISSERLDEIISVLNGEKQLGYEGEHISLLKDIEPIKFDSTISKHVYEFVGREWIYEHIEEWLNEKDNSRVYYITAEAGYGKSSLATYISERHPSSCSIHFCEYDRKSTIDPINILKTFIYQLSTQVPEYFNRLSTINIQKKLNDPKYGSTDIFYELLLNPLEKIEVNKKLFFIIDGLDEATDSAGNNKIVDLIANHFINLPNWINILVTSRPEPKLLRKLKHFNPTRLNANDEHNIEDLRKYIQSRFGKLVDEKIIDALIKKSQGNILYLKSLIDKRETFNIEELEKLPEGIEGFYLQNFERRFNDLDEYDDKYLSFVSILCASKEGLPQSLIQYVLEINTREYKKTIEKFGSLLESVNGFITFYHKSLFDWLSNFDSSGDYSADLELGKKLLLERLWPIYEYNNVLKAEKPTLELFNNTESYRNILDRLSYDYYIKCDKIKAREILSDSITLDSSDTNLYHLIMNNIFNSENSDKDIFSLIFAEMYKLHDEFLLLIVDEPYLEKNISNVKYTVQFAGIDKNIPIIFIDYSTFKDEIIKHFQPEYLPRLIYSGKDYTILADLPVFDYENI